VHTVYSITHII